MKNVEKILRLASCFESLAAKMLVTEAESIFGFSSGKYNFHDLAKTYIVKILDPNLKNPDMIEKINNAYKTLKFKLSYKGRQY
jgi:hypothetical protein